MPKYTGDFIAIDKGVSNINETVSNMINILNNCVNNLDRELEKCEGKKAKNIKKAKEKVISLLDSDIDTFAKLGLYCQDASKRIKEAEETCANFTI